MGGKWDHDSKFMITNINRREHGIGTNVNKDECMFR